MPPASPGSNENVNAEAQKIEKLSKEALSGDKSASQALANEVYGNLQNWDKASLSALQTKLHLDDPATGSLPYITFSTDANGSLGLCIDNGKSREQFSNNETPTVVVDKYPTADTHSPSSTGREGNSSKPGDNGSDPTYSPNRSGGHVQ